MAFHGASKLLKLDSVQVIGVLGLWLLAAGLSNSQFPELSSRPVPTVCLSVLQYFMSSNTCIPKTLKHGEKTER